MKSKKRHQSSSEESEESEESLKSVTSSESESDDSSSERRYKKKRKYASSSSESESDSDNKQKRSKKRKHKKKKKHNKKKRRSESDEAFSLSDGEISPKKKRKHKHKHSKRTRESSVSGDDKSPLNQRLHSVVKEKRESSVERNQPSRTYYQREYHHAGSEDYERQQEVQRFYRGSSKERRHHYEEQAHNRYEKEHDKRYYDQEKYERKREKYRPPAHYDNDQKQREYDDYKKVQKHEEHPYQIEYHSRPKDEYYPKNDYVKKDSRDTRGYIKYNQHEERPNKRREFDDNKPYKERYPPPLMDLQCDRQLFEKRERHHEEKYLGDRKQEVHDERPHKFDKRSAMPQRELPRSKEGYREDERRAVHRDEKYRNGREGPHKDSSERPTRAEGRKEDTRATDNAPRERKSRFANDKDNKEYAWGKTEIKKESDKVEKEKPNFGLSGKLTADVNTVNGVVIKYSEPDDAKQPKRRWRFYPFKGDKELPILYIHRQSAFLIGRDKKVVDIMLEHPSVSKQHAALQYRATPFTRADGSRGRRVRPYIIDLDSANGTFVNNKKIEPRRYVELLERDVVKFGFSQREYVLLHENSKDDAMDDDQPEDAPGVTTTHQIKAEKRIKQEIAQDG